VPFVFFCDSFLAHSTFVCVDSAGDLTRGFELVSELSGVIVGIGDSLSVEVSIVLLACCTVGSGHGTSLVLLEVFTFVVSIDVASNSVRVEVDVLHVLRAEGILDNNSVIRAVASGSLSVERVGTGGSAS